MIDLIKKTMFTGLGLASMTKEKIEELAKEISSKGNLSEKEGEEVFAELTKKSKEARAQIEECVKNSVQENLEKMNMVTKDDLKKLEDKVNKLAEIIEKQQAE